MKRRQWIIIGTTILIILAGYGGCSMLAGMRKIPTKKANAEAYRIVKTTTVQNDTFSRQIPINGKLIATKKLEIYPEVTGRLLPSPTPFKVGSEFKEGEVLLAIDGRESLLNLKSQRSGFINIIAQILPDIKVDYPEEFEAWESYLSQIDPDKELADLPEVKSTQLKNLIAGRNIYQQFYAIKSLENRQQKFTITAPYTGSVSLGNVNPGTVIRAGQKVGEFIQASGYELEAGIALSDAQIIKRGDRVKLNNGISGAVIRISDNADPGTQQVKVYASVHGNALREGSYLSGTMESGLVPNAISIDRNLISDEHHVFILKDSALMKIPVTVAHQFEEEVIVQGLEDGTILLNQVIEGAYQGMKAKPAQAQ
ncbi:MAG: hypothetical protein Salg2KO_08380 [Salibacteraceae bacterium]